jgi:molybdenum cofactor biosynthesis enzyme MoaA
MKATAKKKTTIFNHRMNTQAGRIDEALLCVESTASLKEIALQAKVSLSRVRDHIFNDINNHRRTEKLIALVEYADKAKTRVRVNFV